MISLTHAELERIVHDQVMSTISKMLEQNPKDVGEKLGLSLFVQGLGDSPSTREWYQGRKTDEKGVIVIEVIDKMGEKFISPFTNNWRVRFHLVSGDGQNMDKHMSGLSDVLLVNGTAEIDISGLMFDKVTSKCGDYCQVVAQVFDPKHAVEAVKPWRSEHIRVVSGRCKNTPKRAWETLKPESLISQIPSVGEVLAARFRELGLLSVKDLSSVDLGLGDHHLDPKVLNHVQNGHPNSPFTQAKIIQLVKQAREVCTSAESIVNLFSSSMVEEPKSKRTKFDFSVSSTSPPPVLSSSPGIDLCHKELAHPFKMDHEVKTFEEVLLQPENDVCSMFLRITGDDDL